MLESLRNEFNKQTNLSHIFTIVQGIVPNVLKVLRVTPIFKSGDATVII